MDTNKLITSIAKHIKEAKTLKSYNKSIFEQSVPTGSNEFLFFIKPEITLDQEGIQLESILQMLFQKIEQFGLSLKKASIVNAAYLNKHQIISMHYGVINRMSRDIKKYITSDGKRQFEDAYGESLESANIYGSLEFLEKYSFLSPTALSMLWQNSSFEKLAGGTYATKLKFDGTTYYLVNGFHPRQLEHFTTPGRCIVVLTLTGDTDWKIARNELIGKTNPSDAADGSIRKELLLKKDAYGLDEVSSSWNGVHLSAGPIEGIIELMRYNSDFENHICQVPVDYEFGRILTDEFGSEKVDAILRNPDVTYNGKTESIFDLTEEMNSDECLEVLKKIDSI